MAVIAAVSRTPLRAAVVAVGIWVGGWSVYYAVQETMRYRELGRRKRRFRLRKRPVAADGAWFGRASGEERADVEIVQALAGRIAGMRGIFSGRLRNAHQVESLVANLISVNRRYKAHAGLRVTDV